MSYFPDWTVTSRVTKEDGWHTVNERIVGFIHGPMYCGWVPLHKEPEFNDMMEACRDGFNGVCIIIEVKSDKGTCYSARECHEFKTIPDCIPGKKYKYAVIDNYELIKTKIKVKLPKKL